MSEAAVAHYSCVEAACPGDDSPGSPRDAPRRGRSDMRRARRASGPEEARPTGSQALSVSLLLARRHLIYSATGVKHSVCGGVSGHCAHVFPWWSVGQGIRDARPGIR